MKHAFVFLALGALALASCSKASPPAPQNVLLIVVDTLRADHTGLGSYERETTPNLDALAKQPGAVNFTNARAASPWTKPSVASILTGLAPEDHGVTAHPEKLHADFTTLAEAFRAAGYSTGGVQSNMLISSVFGYDQGFDVWNEDHLATHDTSTGKGINAAALDFLQNGRDKDKPFFLYVHHYEPHFSYLRSGEAWYPDYPGPLTGAESMDALIGATSQLRDEEARFLAARYDAEILYQDQLLAELLAELEKLDQADDTLVVITADHGEEFLEHGQLSHQFTLYEELVHVPLLIVDPRGAEAPLLGTSAGQVSLLDLGHTLLDLTGHEAAAFPGEMLGDEMANVASTRVLGTMPPFALRDMLTIDRWKLIRTQPAEKLAVFELYDLIADPEEQQNLAVEKARLVGDLTKRLDTELLRLHAKSPAGARTAESIELSDEQVQKMKDLGYF